MNLILNTKNNQSDEQKNKVNIESASDKNQKARISILSSTINEAHVKEKKTENKAQEYKKEQNKNRIVNQRVVPNLNKNTKMEVSVNSNIKRENSNRKKHTNINSIPKRENNLSNYRFRGNTYSKKADITKVIKVFSILCIIIGSLIAGKSVYALTFGRPRPKDTPQVSTDKMGKEITITISTQYPIKEFSYRWNDGEATEINGNGTVEISKVIEIPNGNNILNIAVTDYYGNKTEYQKKYLYESSDVVKPTIKFEKVGTKLRVTANDETALLYMEYQWNDEEPIRIDATEAQTELSEEIEVEKGRGKLTVIAVDKEENKETITRTIVGAKKPTFTIEAEQNKLVVKAKDDDGIKSISVFVDEVENKSEQNNLKEAIVKVEIQPGTHIVKVVVVNINDQEATRELKATI